MYRALTLNPQGILQETDSSAENIIVNGDFQIIQRGASFPGVVSGTYPLDCWQYGSSTTNLYDVAQDADIPTVAQSGIFAGKSLLAITKTAQPTLATGTYGLIQQPIEGYRFQQIAQVPFTLSFWVKATKPGLYNVSLRNKGADRSFVATYTIAAANTWEKKSITFPASPSAGTWDYTNGPGLLVTWNLGSGSTYQTSAGSWVTGNFLASPGVVNPLDTVGNQFRLALVEMRRGIYPAPVFPQRFYADELLLCQRYYCRSYLTASGYAPVAGATMGTPVFLPVAMRATPSATLVTANSRSQVSSVTVGIFTGGKEGRFDIVASAVGAFYAIADLWEFNANL